MADLARRLDIRAADVTQAQSANSASRVVASSTDAACREFTKTHDVKFATRPWSSTVRVLMADGSARSPWWSCSARAASSRSAASGRKRSAALLPPLRRAQPGEAVNVSERIAALVSDAAVRTIIGDRFERRDEFLEGLAEGIKITSGFSLGDLFPSSRLASFIGGTTRRAEANHRKNFELMECALKQHEEKRAAAAAAAAGAVEDDEDIVDVLLRIQKEGSLQVPLTMGNIKAVVLVLV
ncbi:hypothetical protein OsJ_05658 [Oryza sativa Japonica Group]|uniref:Uncharacterized protein n=1 Tax=Oryza sativa subsp. japonica TaxID=39947 RepID=B9F3Q5_ORYSJ|nr:hypothetical protein OsJ_05658 [Oryza sativa Japonica Group]